MGSKIPLFRSYADKSMSKAVSEVINRQLYWCNGPEIKEFEKLMAEYNCRKFAVSFNSGTSGLWANLLSLGITSGEVIVPSFSYPATANVVVAAGCRPVFADIEPDTFGLDADEVRKKITKRTRAIMPINFAGNICRDINKIKEISDKNNILLIEDNAHSFGARLGGKMAGNFGNSSVISLAFNKIISTGEGGMVFTDDLAAAEKLKLIRDNGCQQIDGRKDYINWGLNLSMSSMTAVLGLMQLRKIKYIIRKRRNLAERYNQVFRNIKSLTIPSIADNSEAVFQLYNVLLENKESRDSFMNFLADRGIPTRVTYFPIHHYSYYQKRKKLSRSDLIMTEKISNRIVTLPLYPDMKKLEQDEVVKVVKEYFSK